MQKFIIGVASLLLFVGCLFLMTDMIIGDTTHTDNKSALERAGSTAMDKAVKVGILRAQEEIAIDTEIAKKEFEKSYKQNATFKDPASKREFSAHAVQEQPAMIAVEGDAEAASYTKQFDEKKGSIKSNAKHIFIYEADSDNKKAGGNVK
ncbi:MULTISPECIES: hypothetical protein [Bacillus cereus group]|uniref:hypothetical protein n=1 Tax=Bacillus cereus group TaxID=86661 RepID=UPI0007FB3055|nr:MULTISPECIES: hypothetical protein [Bacillus cereus group]MCP1399333.1 hypothetical protein [Bacillus cereus]MED3686583.1 hypothetical protein [Bacillus thuringiensis]OBW84814.1 hypothetical protein A9L49_30290 [Bacillus cereus]PER53104.1 hypothetical protein CN486_23430 [Bacillus thuringiensis]PEV49820.1 hypothetical protein CN426_04480 [Bacillus thuringiensis]